MLVSELNKDYELFDRTPECKSRVFDKPKLFLVSGNEVAYCWDNTQPLYLFPLSLLDFLNARQPPVELQVFNACSSQVISTIRKQRFSKIHFEKIDEPAIEHALLSGSKVSVLCSSTELVDADTSLLSHVNYLRVKTDCLDGKVLGKLQSLRNPSLLLGAKIYLSPGRDYFALANGLKSAGVDFVHVSKFLEAGGNSYLSATEKSSISGLKELETSDFRVILPRDLTKLLNDRFEISPLFNNSRSCSSSRYRVVMHDGSFYPCYTLSVLESGRFAKAGLEQHFSGEPGASCSDCACIYENDILHDLFCKLEGVKNHRFLLGYKHGKE